VSGRVLVRPLVVVALLLVTPRLAEAQGSGQPSAAIEPEVRADLLLASRHALQLGVGAQLPVGYYVRIGAVGAVGSTSDGRLDGRLDLLGRFLLDPFRQSACGVSAGGGVSARFEPGERVRPLLLVALEVEGRRREAGWVPALQVGLGGGVRIGLVVRGAAAGYR
jgi:hypothetical protein